MFKKTTVRRCWRGLAILFLSVGTGRPVSAQSSDEGAPFLLLPVGAGAVAMGRAVTALPGPEAPFWNPAGLASLERSRLVLLRSDVAAGQSTAIAALFASPGVGTLGVSYLLRDEGDQEYTDAYDNVLGKVSLRDHVLLFSAAASLAPGLQVGANFKVLSSKWSCRGDCLQSGSTSTGYAVDLGAQWVPLRDLPLRVGAVVAHLGPRFQLKNASQADPLPTRVRVGAAYDVLHGLGTPGLEGWVTIEVEDRPGYRGGTNFFVGSELAAGVDDALFLRIGYAGDGPLPGGPRAGLGLRLKGYDFAVARSLSASSLDVTEPLSFSLSILW